MRYFDPTFYRQTMALQISLLILSAISVVLRYLSRLQKGAKLKSDDLWAFIALLTYFVYLAVCFLGLFNGGGLQPELLPPAVFERGLKATYAAGILALCTITAAKLSILMLYRRLFLVDKGFRIASSIMLVVCLMWCLASALSFAFSCTPVYKSWQPLAKGHCFSLKTYFLAEEVPNCVMDFIIVLLPLGVVQKLKLPTIQKLNLLFLFLLGGFVSVISIIRIKLTLNELSFNDRLNSGKWLTIQLGFAVICCSLPTYRPLLPPSAKFTSRIAAVYSSLHSLIPRMLSRSSGSRIDDSSMHIHRDTSRHNLYESIGDENAVNTVCTIDANGVVREGYPMHSIKATTSVDVV